MRCKKSQRMQIEPLYSYGFFHSYSDEIPINTCWGGGCDDTDH